MFNSDGRWENTPQITRRHLLASTAVLSLAHVMTTVMGPMGAFAQELSPSPSATLGGTLTMQLVADPPNYDPMSNQSSFVINVLAPCYNNLVRYNPFDPNSVVGDLAEGWEVSADELTYAFKLRSGVKWHDGQPFTAADVKHTFDVLRDPPEGTISLRRDLLTAVVSINIVDDTTVNFVLSRPQATLLQILAIGWMVVLPKHIMDAKGSMKNDIVGTGPFKFAQHEIGVSLDLVRNDEYFVPDRPYLDAIRFFVVPNRSAAFNYTITGEMLLLDNPTVTEANTATSMYPERVNVQTTQSYTFWSLTINADVAPWNDIRVRKAVSLAIDRNEALKVLRDGAGVVGGLLPPGPWQLPADELQAIPGYGDDIEASREEARRLLAEAGFADGFTAEIITRTGATFEASAVFAQDQLRKIGITTTIAPQEPAIFQENILKKNFTISPFSRTVYVNHPDAIMPDLYRCGGAQNYSSVCSAEADQLFDTIAGKPIEEQVALSHAVETQIMAEFGDIVLLWRDRALILGKSVQDYRLHPEPENNRRMEEVWLGTA